MIRYLFLFLLFCGYLGAADQPPLPPELVDKTPLPEDHFFRDFMNMLASLGLIVMLIFIVSWGFKRFLNTRIQQMNVSSSIKIVERRSLTPKTAIYLLEIHGKGVAIAESANGVTRLVEFPPGSDFEEILRSKMEEEEKATPGK